MSATNHIPRGGNNIGIGISMGLYGRQVSYFVREVRHYTVVPPVITHAAFEMLATENPEIFTRMGGGAPP